MKKFIIHTEWMDYYRRLLVESGSDAHKVLEVTLEAFILFDQINYYAESGEYSFFNDCECQRRAKAMFLSLKPQIDADLKAFKKSRGAMIAEALKENARENGLNS